MSVKRKTVLDLLDHTFNETRVTKFENLIDSYLTNEAWLSINTKFDSNGDRSWSILSVEKLTLGDQEELVRRYRNEGWNHVKMECDPYFEPVYVKPMEGAIREITFFEV